MSFDLYQCFDCSSEFQLETPEDPKPVFPPCPTCGLQFTHENWLRCLDSLPVVRTDDNWTSYYDKMADRDFPTRQSFRSYERQLEAEGKYIKGGAPSSNLPTDRRIRRNIAEHGAKWLEAVADDPRVAEDD